MDGNSSSAAIMFSSEAAVRGAGDAIAPYLGVLWVQAKALVIVPVLRVMVYLCLVMLIMILMEKVYLGAVSAYLKLFRRTPAKQYKWEPIKKEDDAEIGNSGYPTVLVQIPMCNEKRVYQLSIGAACNLSWPTNRIIIQVLDDSTDPEVKALVQQECRRWAGKGVNIKYETRDNRKGFKAGSLKQGMKHSYVKSCEYVAIFDADFEPDPDFLYRTIPFLVHNPDIGLVQARWKYVNANECMLTRLQEMSMDRHFSVEQEVGSAIHAFFGFNGTAGIWRIAALDDAGGWKDRTTVEDMDLGCRAGLKGWKFVFLGDVRVKSELPSSFKAYRYQQHRWSCGPANLFKKMTFEIMRNKKVTIWKKLYLIYAFFFVNKIVAHVLTFIYYCLVLPATVLIPELKIPLWGALYVPTLTALLTLLPCPRSLHMTAFWMLFENVMALHRTIGTFIGLLEVGRIHEWVVTEKQGNTKTAQPKSAKKVPRFRLGERLHLWEIIVGFYMLFCGWYNLIFGDNYYYVYLFLQGVSFLVIGFGYIGAFVTTS
ncbi:PREDICTED: glucomannan 4-beta-mannosyltransferase 9-like [Ipomoea nil]|uniref:glucomannan 4-beta-mannosyltransferase 9-like n=1 Tax=Ipomoea nil TaxID=35883 RepID=UPI000901FC27|nr:PREDICTED: glucomannan 4-beta-mannosyltransferase 9-like [Ipomoea nil]